VVTARTCDRCGATYEAKRMTSRYCSSKCRAYASLNKAPAPNVADRQQPISAAGIDPASIDPRWILAGIAIDPSAPAAARVVACKALMVDAAGGVASKKEKALLSLNERAIALMAGTQPLVH
jgi:hypothetical protein